VLISRENLWQAVTSERERWYEGLEYGAAMRIERFPYFADVLEDRAGGTSRWHCIIQRQGSSEMLVWRQYGSEEEAHKEALTEMNFLLDRDRRRAGQMDLPISPDASKPDVA
jgi:hypothetical protein